MVAPPQDLSRAPLAARVDSRRRTATIALFAAAAVYLAVQIVVIVQARPTQWDFKMCYLAAKAHQTGLFPYSTQVLTELAGYPIQRFSYSPLTLWFFRPFSRLPFRTAAVVYLALKVAILAGLAWLWRHRFLGRDFDGWFAVFALLAFNGTIFLDLFAGNVSMIEQGFLWIAFAALLRKRWLAFGLLVTLAALFKTVLIVFLGLPILLEGARRIRTVAGLAVPFLLINGIGAVVSPLFRESYYWLVHTGLIPERGIVNPSAFALFSQLAGAVAGDPWARAWLAWGVYLLFAAIVAGLTFAAIRRVRAGSSPDLAIQIVFLCCFAYALVIPRMKDYSYILLIVPAYAAIKKAAARSAFPFLFVLSVLTVPANTSLPGLAAAADILWAYWPLFTALILWALSLHHILSKRSAASLVEPAPAGPGVV